MFNIVFNQESSQFLYHPRYKDIVPRILNDLSYLKNHFILFSSGTTSTDPKGYAVSEEALLINAQAVNSFYNLTQDDIWGLSLPYYHIGGLSVIARAHLLGSKIIDLSGKWDPLLWAQKLESEGITITTVVPTQIYDLVKNKIAAPKKLRFIIVGGDFLSSSLSEQAINLGWPIVKTFGMTEVCSQLACTASAHLPELQILPIHQIKIDQDQRLWVKSGAMYTLEFILKNNVIEIVNSISRLDSDGYFPTNDRAIIKDQSLFHLGRLDDQIKINGRLTSINSLKEILYNYALSQNLYGHLELRLTDDQRSGKVIEILFDHPINQVEVSSLFLPARPNFLEVTSFERTDLGKLKK